MLPSSWTTISIAPGFVYWFTNLVSCCSGRLFARTGRLPWSWHPYDCSDPSLSIAPVTLLEIFLFKRLPRGRLSVYFDARQRSRSISLITKSRGLMLANPKLTCFGDAPTTAEACEFGFPLDQYLLPVAYVFCNALYNYK